MDRVTGVGTFEWHNSSASSSRGVVRGGGDETSGGRGQHRTIDRNFDDNW